MIISDYATKFMGFLNNPKEDNMCMPLTRSAWYQEHCSECVYDFADNRMVGWLGTRSEEINKICEMVDRAYNDYTTRFYACGTPLSLSQVACQILKMSAFICCGLAALKLSAINYRVIKKDEGQEEKNWKGSKSLLAVTSSVAALCLASGAYMAVTNPMSAQWIP